MNTKPLEKFAQAARRQLHEQVRARLEQVLRTDSPEIRAKAKVVADLNKQIAGSFGLFVNPVVLGSGIPLFPALNSPLTL